MSGRYVVTYEYTEIVKGKPRHFVHETILEAPDVGSAHTLALAHFHELARQSSVGWARILERCETKPARPGATAKGGRRANPEAARKLRDHTAP